MIDYDSLIAARAAIHNGVNPIEVRKAMLKIEAGESKKTLLFELMSAGALSEEHAKRAHTQTQRYNFLRAESAYVHILRHEQLVTEDKLEAIRSQQKESGFQKGLGALLIEEGLIDKETDEAIKKKAITALFKENKRLVEKSRTNQFYDIEGMSSGGQGFGTQTGIKVSKIVDAEATRKMLEELDDSDEHPDDSEWANPWGLSEAEMPSTEPKKPVERGPISTLPFPQSSAPPPPPPAPGVAAIPRKTSTELPVPLAPPPTTPPPPPTAPPPAVSAPASKAPAKAPEPMLTRAFDADELSASVAGPLKGTGLETRYKVLKKLGQGGMGAVYLVEELDGEARQCALKLILDSEKNPDAMGRFKREILCNSFFSHPAVIEIYDGGKTDDGAFFMAMEYFDGEPLSDLLKSSGPLKLKVAVDFFKQGLEALEAAHEARIIHRDLKPENFLVAKQANGNLKMKLMDWGIARILDDEQDFSDQFFTTMQGKLTGSPAYIAPESITEPKVDARADLYSMGIMLYSLSVGQLPFKAPSAQEYLAKHLYEKPPIPEDLGAHRGVNKALSDYILKLIEKLPKNRFQSATEALKELNTKVLPSFERSTKNLATAAFDPSVLQAKLGGPEAPSAAPSAPEATAGMAPEVAAEFERQKQEAEEKAKLGWFGSLKKRIFGS